MLKQCAFNFDTLLIILRFLLINSLCYRALKSSSRKLHNHWVLLLLQLEQFDAINCFYLVNCSAFDQVLKAMVEKLFWDAVKCGFTKYSCKLWISNQTLVIHLNERKIKASKLSNSNSLQELNACLGIPQMKYYA